jgi:hypothetical protein
MADRTCPTCLHIYRYPNMLKFHFKNVYHCKKNEDEIKEYFIINKINTNSINIYTCSKCIKEFTPLKI